MSTIGSPIETSLVQAAQAQQSASRARDRERATTESARQVRDQVELRIAGAESADAVRRLPQNDSEQAEAEHDRNAGDHRPVDQDHRPHVDVTA